MYVETFLFHIMKPNKNVLLETHLLFMTIYGLMWSCYHRVKRIRCDLTYARSDRTLENWKNSENWNLKVFRYSVQYEVKFFSS